MRNNTLANIITSRLLAIQRLWAIVKIYVFGSILIDEINPCDIDILVVLASDIIPQQLRDELEHLNVIHPVHILIMTKNEEMQFNFIKEQAAVPIWELAQQTNSADAKSARLI